MRLWVLAAILTMILAGCSGGEEEFTAPTEHTEIVKDETEVTQAPPGDKE
jgi:PBP1b-binding outer membrane lipoprotein LpoB